MLLLSRIIWRGFHLTIIKCDSFIIKRIPPNKTKAIIKKIFYNNDQEMKETITIYKLSYPNSYITKTQKKNAKSFVRYDDKLQVCKVH